MNTKSGVNDGLTLSDLKAWYKECRQTFFTPQNNMPVRIQIEILTDWLYQREHIIAHTEDVSIGNEIAIRVLKKAIQYHKNRALDELLG